MAGKAAAKAPRKSAKTSRKATAPPARETQTAVPRSRAASPPFDPATGDWLVVSEGPPPRAPDEPKRGGGATFWNIVLILDLAVLGIFALLSAWIGVVLVAAPDSHMAERFRESFVLESASDLVVNSLIPFVLFGAIPFLWTLGTRVQPWEGTKRFLHLQDVGPSILRGIGLAALCLVGVVVLVSAYELALHGVDGLKDPSGDGDNPAVSSILEHLTWPLAALVALCAGVGEEIFFRGLLQRKLGLWPQAALFGFAHLAGGYLPQVVAALGLGVLFGYVVKRGGSLVTTITAHVAYDFTLLAIALVFPQYA